MFCFSAQFFITAMRIVSALKHNLSATLLYGKCLFSIMCDPVWHLHLQCLDTKDIEQAYRVHELLRVGENWRLMGNDLKQNIY